MNLKTLFSTLALSLVAIIAVAAHASEGPEIKYVGVTADRTDSESLQRGARLFVNY